MKDPNKDKQRGAKQLIAAALMGAGAYGTHQLGEWAVPKDTRNALSDFYAFKNNVDRRHVLAPNTENPMDTVQEYARQGSNLMRQKVFGVPAKDFTQKVREWLPVEDKWKTHVSDAHYDAFKRGPAYGAIQLLDENAGQTSSQTLDPERANYLGHTFSKELTSRLKTISEKRLGFNALEGMTSLREGLPYQGKTLSPENQDVMMGSLGDSPLFQGRYKGLFGRTVPDRFKDEFDRVVRETANGVREHSLPAYAQLGKALGTIHSSLSHYAPAALGLGAATLGGIGAYHLLKSPDKPVNKPKKEEEKQAAMKATPLDSVIIKLALTEDDINRLIPEDLGARDMVSEATLFPGAYRRAGRAQGLAESFGNDTPLSVRHPKTMRWLLGMAGTAAGAGIGGNIGSAFDRRPEDGARGAAAGTVLGGLGGLGAAGILDAIIRRSDVKGVKRKAIEDLRGGETPSSAIGQGSLLSSLVSGVHQQGRADTAETIAHGKRNYKGNPGMVLAQLLGGAPVSAVGSLVNTGEARGRIEGARPQATRAI